MKARTLAFGGILAAVYAAVTLLTASFSFGPLQLRLADALCVFCCFTPAAIPGLTLGCLIANLFSPVSLLDAIIGTAATLLSCLWMTRCRRGWQSVVPNVAVNAVMVGALLAWVMTPERFWLGLAVNGAQVAAGETIVMTALGLPLYWYLKRTGVWKKI